MSLVLHLHGEPGECEPMAHLQWCQPSPGAVAQLTCTSQVRSPNTAVHTQPPSCAELYPKHWETPHLL